MDLRLEGLRTERTSWMSHYKELSSFILPRSGRFFVDDRNKGDRRHNNIYDSTGTRALRVLGAGLMGGATSPARPWFRLSTPDLDLLKYAPVKIWLNDVTRNMLDIFQRSNTYRSLHGIYEELGTFGTGADLFLKDFSQVVRHYPSTCGEYFLAANSLGTVDTMYREFQKPVNAVVGEFGYKNCSSSVQSLYDNGNLEQWITICHGMEPRSDRDPRVLDARNMAWKSCYWEKGQNAVQFLRESGFKSFRALCPRWALSGSDILGNGPGMESLGDIKQLQHQQLRKAEAIDFMTKPPLQIPTSMKNREVERMPGGISYIDMSGANGGAKTMFDVQLNLEHLLGDIQDVRGRIKETFYTDLFLMLANQTDARMTATEVAERHEEKLLMLGPVLERLHNELLDPMITITFSDMLEAGIVPPPPPELHGQQLNVEFVSMLAQAQRAVSTNSVDRFVGNLGQIAELIPGVLDKFDADHWADSYADMLGIDPELIVADDKVALIRKQRAATQAAQQKMAMAESAANTANKLGNTPTTGSNALTDATAAFSGYS